ncbi:hypothetical protein [Mycobacterium branderi]|uniref:Mce associated membrane protein n=1 Tax=Mycobacterium branderi TaxID=43348 RepID=A0A7I7W0K4_9MYCO|nr:hypothetical protein [Mycobacterium branderi]MCV7235508.1 hypothetical protein [Mycobacterium branderi]ORA34320.1 hypothetical protein BST20_20045 [Mycobacterium branderi]BBZ11134.1 hypothetical protein MBRA_13290 [Mycobacterium branderi]
MPDAEQSEPAAEEAPGGPIFSVYGIGSTVLGVLSVAAIALGVLIWTTHRGDVDERHYQSRVMQTAAEWTGVLINMNTDNVDANLQRLHDGTVGELNADFDSAMQPYRQVVQRLQARSTGQIEAVAIESVHHEPDAQPGRRPADPLPAGIARRTDTVMVVATSVSENVGGKPQIVHWNLRLAVSDVDGRLLISQLGSIR